MLSPGINSIEPYMRFENYLKIQAVSSTMIRNALKSPANIRQQNFSSDAMRVGSAIDCAVIEPDLFKTDYIKTDGSRKGSKKYDEFKSSLTPGITILNNTDYGIATGCAKSISQYPEIKDIIDRSYKQLSFFWKTNDHVSNHKCKGRADLVDFSTRTIYDLKSTSSVDNHKFIRSIFEFGYHIQAAFYLNGLNEAIKLGESCYEDQEVDSFKIISIEKTPPYRVKVFSLGEDVINYGVKCIRDGFEVIVECELNNNYINRDYIEVEVSLPEYLRLIKNN